MSYTNLIMYSSVIPSEEDSKESGGKKNKRMVINCDDPRNKNSISKLISEME